MHYPAITGAIYIPPSITDTYYSPPAVQRLPHNFLKAAPYILIRQELLCKCKADDPHPPTLAPVPVNVTRFLQDLYVYISRTTPQLEASAWISLRLTGARFGIPRQQMLRHVVRA
ncbi:hypothetical protein C0J50_0955 [Silurus asotus]|uniref:Uncharacterized protein n=1 Tax=Silurus asotus TaxID=30991 RepID=A0AAD5AA16_SILAS|nr:hypothetical protein C0J50_0955 [Silurus asotus]